MCIRDRIFTPCPPQMKTKSRTRQKSPSSTTCALAILASGIRRTPSPTLLSLALTFSPISSASGTLYTSINPSLGGLHHQPSLLDKEGEPARVYLFPVVKQHVLEGVLGLPPERAARLVDVVDV